MKVYDPDNVEVGDAPAWLVEYAETCPPMPWLVVQRSGAPLTPIDRREGAERPVVCALQRCMLEDRDDATGQLVGEPRRALRLRDAASVGVFRAILEDEAKRHAEV